MSRQYFIILVIFFQIFLSSCNQEDYQKTKGLVQYLSTGGVREIPELDMSNHIIYDTIFGSFLKTNYSPTNKSFMKIYNGQDTIFCEITSVKFLDQLPYNGYFIHNGKSCFVWDITNSHIPKKLNGKSVVFDYNEQFPNNHDELLATYDPVTHVYAITQNGMKFKKISVIDY